MRLVRFQVEGKTRYGRLAGDRVIPLAASPFRQALREDTSSGRTGESHLLSRVRLLAPMRPSKVVCVGLNYRTHAVEMKQAIPPVPLLFLKPPTAVIGPDESIVLPRDHRRVDYEAELGVIIGRRCKDVAEADALDYVLGYTCFNDVTERVVQKEDVQWTRAKSYDTFAPIGPWIETDLDTRDIKVEAYLNSERRQAGRTSDLIFTVPALVSFISGVMTLLPGDVIATGTPSGIGPMKSGDTIEIVVEGVGTLHNTVA